MLEELFDLPAAQRTPEQARDLLAPAWRMLVEQDPALAALAQESDQAAWMAGCATVLERWFTLEDPQRLEPAEREAYVETLLDSRLLLRGFVDRIDVAPGGEVRVVDYKTGRSPGPAYEAQALFQMRFYALVLWRARGVLPAVLQLVYLGNGEILRYVPDEDDLRATQRRVEALWQAISHRARGPRLAAQPGPSLRLVLVPLVVPGVRRHAAAPARRSSRRRGSAARAPSAVAPSAVAPPAVAPPGVVPLPVVPLPVVL